MLKNNITPIYLLELTQVVAEGRVRGGLAEGWGNFKCISYHLKCKSFLDRAIMGGGVRVGKKILNVSCVGSFLSSPTNSLSLSPSGMKGFGWQCNVRGQQ